MRIFGYMVVTLLCASFCTEMSAQVDKRDVRAGNRQYRKEEYKKADISFRKALVKDSTSVAANYNLAAALYRQGGYDEAGKVMEKISGTAPLTAKAADYHYNKGDIALALKDYAGAVEAFRQSLLKNPQDLEAKENYIYAKKMLDDQNKNGGGGGNDQNGGDDNNPQNQDQNGGGDDQQNGQQDRKQNDQQGEDNQQQDQSGGQKNGQQGQQPAGISPQQAQQMLKAIQAKEKQTQDKVNKEKAEGLKSRQKEKNW